ncbi:MAG TPA: hypothetical protein VGR07_01125 [Thermoanaerobaculia bacterium]|jgi:hypothetical protein|nr:hypothetical protein [Thermoanaerobaculia bacterium]
MKTIRPCALLALAVVSALLAGCFDVEQSMSLEKDLSGTAGFAMTVNFEPMALMMLRMQREMAGTKGDPTPAEIEKAKQDFLASKKDKSPAADFAAKRAEFEKSLPPGVQLVDGGADDQGLKMRAHFKFRFDNVAKLGQIRFTKDEAQQQSGPKNPYDEPFAGIKVVDEGKTVLLTSATVDPLKKQQEEKGGPELTPEMKQQMAEAFKGFRVAFKLDTPMAVVESNATRRDGHTLYWEYDLPTLEKMSKEQAQTGIRVRLRK